MSFTCEQRRWIDGSIFRDGGCLNVGYLLPFSSNGNERRNSDYFTGLSNRRENAPEIYAIKKTITVSCCVEGIRECGVPFLRAVKAKIKEKKSAFLRAKPRNRTATDSGFVSRSQGRSPKRRAAAAAMQEWEEREGRRMAASPAPLGRGRALWTAQRPGPRGGVTLQVALAAPFTLLPAAPSRPLGLLSDPEARPETAKRNRRPGIAGPARSTARGAPLPPPDGAMPTATHDRGRGREACYTDQGHRELTPAPRRLQKQSEIAHFPFQRPKR